MDDEGPGITIREHDTDYTGQSIHQGLVRKVRVAAYVDEEGKAVVI